MEDACKLLRELLLIPSVNGKHNEGKMAEFLCGYFERAGIPAKVQVIDGVHANVVATLEGKDAKKVTVWNGHLDTVPYGELREWDTEPQTPVEKDGFLYARGASDMKSGLAAMVFALCDFAGSGEKPKNTVQFIGTCDEEKGGLGARKILEAGLMKATDELLIGEPTSCGLGLAQKGCLWLEINVSGKTSHGAYPAEGCNAVSGGFLLASRIADYVSSFSHPLLKTSTAQITQIEGGIAPNMTPDSCRILMDIRMTPGLTVDMVLKTAGDCVDRIREEEYPELLVEFVVRNDRIAIELDLLHPMAARLERCIHRAGEEISYVGINYFTDASILVKTHPETAVLLFGPGEPGMAHKPNERVEISKYLKAIQILKDMLR